MMQYKQIKKGLVRQVIDIELRDTGLNYKITTKVPFRKEGFDEEYISYAAIENARLREKKTHPIIKRFFVNTSIVVLVVYYIALFSFLKSTAIQSNPETEMFFRLLTYVPVFLWFPLYSFFVTQKVIYMRVRDSYYTIFDNVEGEKIMKDIFEHRNTFFRKTYLEGEALNHLTKSGLEFLRSSKVINDLEFERFNQEIEKRPKAVGFETGDTVVVTEKNDEVSTKS